MKRRSFIIKFLLGVVGLLTLDAFWFERYIIDWNTFDISKGNKNKIKAIQLSDLHLTEIRSTHKSLAERINSELPDLICITGDAITRNSRIPILHDFLALLDPNIQKVAILGNKEHSGRVDLNSLKETYKASNCLLLVNESYIFRTRQRAINLMGIDDFVSGKPNFKQAARAIDIALPLLVLNHCPQYRSTIDKVSTELNLKPFILSGHTHGGQVAIFGKPLFTPYGSGNYIKGWYTNETSQMYVSKGIGTTVLPVRFGARAEASIFYL
jgi:predicted MPP superfamily phosphohydrolase